ncbi:MAG: Calx-beta domain-containing protein [Nodosilinea sp.]
MPIAVSISGDSFAAIEGKNFIQITLLTSRPVPFGELVAIDFEISPGTAVPKKDYRYQSSTAVFVRQSGTYADRLNIPGGASIGSFTIEILKDKLVEDNEEFTVTITGVSPNAQIGDNASISISIFDQGSVVNQVAITTASDTIEPGQNGQFIVSLNQVSATDTVFTYSVSGTATADEDYTSLGGMITIPAGDLSASIDVRTLDDMYLEGEETVTVTLTAVTSSDDTIVLGEINTATVTIADNSSTVRYRVNAGGPEIAAIDGGLNWLADDAFLANPGSDSIFRANTAVKLNDTVPNTTPEAVFETERFDTIQPLTDAELQYAFAVDPGMYEVRLYLGNSFEGTSLVGQRIFDVAIENQVLPGLDNIDLIADFGHLTGGMISEIVEVTDSILNLDFLHDAVDGVQNPLINGIEIIQVGDATLPPTVTVAGAAYTVEESEGFVKVTLLTSEPVAANENVTIRFEIVPGSANVMEDYAYESATAVFDPQTGIYTDVVTIPSGFSTAGIPIKILQDILQEGDEIFTVNITDADSNFQVGANSSTSITIEDGSLSPTSILIEAEDTVYSGYQLETIIAASGGQALRPTGHDLENVGLSTLAVDNLTGFAPGEYDIVIGALGVLSPGGLDDTTLSLELNGRLVRDVSLRNFPLTEPSNQGATMQQIVATGVQLTSGDSLAIVGVENPNEAIWLDYIQLNFI